MVETAANPKAIVIDDERLIADTLALILNHHGYEASSAYSGEEALEQVDRLQPDIVLSDVRMHELDGIETALRIRALHPGCRVILFSASYITDDEQERIDESGFEFLRRPLHPRELLSHLQESRTPSNVIQFQPARRSDPAKSFTPELGDRKAKGGIQST